MPLNSTTKNAVKFKITAMAKRYGLADLDLKLLNETIDCGKDRYSVEVNSDFFFFFIYYRDAFFYKRRVAFAISVRNTDQNSWKFSVPLLSNFGFSRSLTIRKQLCK